MAPLTLQSKQLSVVLAVGAVQQLLSRSRGSSLQVSSTSGAAARHFISGSVLEKVLDYYKYMWPLSRQSSPLYVVTIIVLSAHFYQAFFNRKGNSKAIFSYGQKKHRNYLDLMRVLQADVTKKVCQAKEEGKTEAEIDELEGQPEAERVQNALWDDVQESRTTIYMIKPDDPAVLFCEQLLKRRLNKELSEALSKTKKARGLLLEERDAEDETFHNCEELRKKFELAEDVVKRFGAVFVDQDVLQAVRVLLDTAKTAHMKSKRMLLNCLKPVVFDMLIATPSQLISTSFQSVYYHTSSWVLIGEYALMGNDYLEKYQIVNVLVGHMLIYFFEVLRDSWTSRAQNTLRNNLHHAVMRALLHQDTEFFDKHAPGALQERLNRDATELGDNLLKLPLDLLGSVSKITVSLWQVYFIVPSEMFWVAVAPLPLASWCHYRITKFTRKMEEKKRKLEEEAAATTSEVLSEIKTVRQFASEHQEILTYSRNKTMGTVQAEKSVVMVRIAQQSIGVMIITGLMFTLRLGQHHIRQGNMTPVALWDIACKLNFWVVFTVKDIFESMPQLVRALEPLGRIAELLDSNPKIEPKVGPQKVVVHNRESLDSILDLCETHSTKKHSAQTLLREEWVPPAGAGTVAVRQGAALLCYGPDGEPVLGKTWLAQQPLAFPLTLGFSRKLRPAQLQGRIEFDNVHFSFPTEMRKPVLRGLSFTVEPGQKVALVGEAGCGKSTCMALLQRLYDPSSGVIRLDGVPLPEYDVHFLRSRMVLVDQKSVLFARSVRENVTYGLSNQHVPDEEVIQALRDASMWEGENCLESMPDQLFTKVGNGGISLSGGQTQRVAIARAMIRNPDVILLDEATSSLDNQNERDVQEALDKLARRGSALVIAHRLTTIMDAEKIVVLNRGVVAEEGTHAELLAKPIVKEDEEDTGDHDSTAHEPKGANDRRASIVSGIYRHLWELPFRERDSAGEATSEMQVPSSFLPTAKSEATRNIAEKVAAVKCENDEELLAHLRRIVAEADRAKGDS